MPQECSPQSPIGLRFAAPLVAALLTAGPALMAGVAGAGDPPGHAVVSINVPDRSVLRQIFGTGIDPEGSSGRTGGPMEFIATPSELRELDALGIRYTVTDADPAASAARTLAADPQVMNALGFGTGSMGGYYTLDEVAGQLDSMKLLFPALVSDRQEIGYSHEGRPIWGVMISDNADTDEEGEPEALYTALTHAREPAGMMTVIYYMWWLLEQYGSDPEATYLVNNRQLWFIPVINVDGYAYNESTNPSGGGFWRKNRRNNGNGTWGVDLNRNYGPEYMWNAPNGGSSTSTSSDTYRGPNPFSEPETQTIDSFMRLRRIETCLNYHTYSRLLIYPYGYLEAESPDSSRFREYAFDMTRINRYATGTDQQTVQYSTRGNSDDYMYGDTTKRRTYALTPEVGTSFWPPSSQILPLALENLGANIHCSFVAGPMPALGASSLPQSPGDGFLPGEPFAVSITVRNKGLDTASSVGVGLAADSGWLQFSGPEPVIHTLLPGSDTVVTLGGTVAGDAPPGSSGRLLVNLTDPQGYARTDTALLYIGQPVVVFEDGAESGMGLWTASGSWGLSGTAQDGALSFHDSPAGASPVSSTGSIRTSAPINLMGFPAAKLEFWTRWAVEPSYDFAVVRISTDSGTSWSALRTSLSNQGSGSGVQTTGVPGYDGYTPGLDWIRQEADLSAFAGSAVLLRFEMNTDGADSRDGWYVDDIRVTAFRPTIPGGSLHVSSASLAEAAITFGEWPGATVGIDSALGEAGLGPIPPGGTFDVRWEIPGTNGALTDIRDTLGAPPDTNVFTLLLQGSGSDYPLGLSWNRDALSAGSWRLRDSLPSGGSVDVDMWKAGAAAISDTSVGRLYVVHASAGTASMSVPGGWSLVSLPVAPGDSAVTAVFPGATGQAWSFDGGYNAQDYLSPGPGYWIRNSTAETVQLDGVPFTPAAVINPGGDWTLIGASYCEVLRSAICPWCPAPPIVYGYRNGYYIADTLRPGEGYWYKGVDALQLDCGIAGGGPAAPSAGIAMEAALHSLTMTDGSGAMSILKFGRNRDAGGTDYALPPAPPAPLFDARFETENAVEYFDREGAGAALGIRITNARGDITVTMRGGETQGRFALEVLEPGARPVVRPLAQDIPIVVSRGAGLRLLVLRDAGDYRDPLPESFRVHGNFPNPFNPRTWIGVALPARAVVNLRITTLAGQEVDAGMQDRELPAGEHRIAFEAGSLASGVYLYTVTARSADPRGSGRFTGKFVLLK